MLNLGEVLDDGTIIDGTTGEIIDIDTKSESLITNYDPLEAALVELETLYGKKDEDGNLVIPDANTKDGYELLKTGVKNMTKVRTTLDKVRAIIKAPVIKRGKDIDGEANRIKARIEAIEGPYKAAKKLKDDEEKVREAARLERITGLIESMRNKPLDYMESSPELIKIAIETLEGEKCDKSDFHEFTMDALEVRNKSLEALSRILSDREKAEELAAEAEENARIAQLEERLRKIEGARVISRKDTVSLVESRVDWLRGHKVEKAAYGEFTDRAEIARRDSIEELEAELVEMRDEEAKLAKLAKIEADAANPVEDVVVDSTYVMAETSDLKQFSQTVLITGYAKNEKDFNSALWDLLLSDDFKQFTANTITEE